MPPGGWGWLGVDRTLARKPAPRHRRIVQLLSLQVALRCMNPNLSGWSTGRERLRSPCTQHLGIPAAAILLDSEDLRGIGGGKCQIQEIRWVRRSELRFFVGVQGYFRSIYVGAGEGHRSGIAIDENCDPRVFFGIEIGGSRRGQPGCGWRRPRFRSQFTGQSSVGAGDPRWVMQRLSPGHHGTPLVGVSPIFVPKYWTPP